MTTAASEGAAGATALVRRAGRGEVTSAGGAKVALGPAMSAQGYGPLELLYAALAGCLALSARAAASEMHLIDQFVEAKVAVSGHKAKGPPARIAQLDIAIDIVGDFDDDTRRALIERAEELCTVSNTLLDPPMLAVNR